MEYDVKSLVIGLDLGGTNSVFGIVDGGGEIIATTSIKTQAFQRVEQYVEESVKPRAYYGMVGEEFTAYT